jgi:hypothetical protein
VENENESELPVIEQTDTAVIVVATYHENFCTVKLFDPMTPETKELASATVILKDGKGIARATAEAFQTLESKAQR